MQAEEIEHALARAQDIAHEAAAFALTGFQQSRQGQQHVEKKGTIDLVTRFDRDTEDLIVQQLGQYFPGHAVVGEEGTGAGAKTATATSDYTWYVDPIDGTTNFAHGHPFFCVSIALYQGDRPLVGVIEAPALGLCWWAASGMGAWCNGQVCRVSSTTTLVESLCATGFPYDCHQGGDNNESQFSLFLRRARGIRRCGSAAIDLALVADGTYELYWERGLKCWDQAAGMLLIAEAGGQVSDYQGQTIHPHRGETVASNGHVHQEALRLLAKSACS